MTAAALRDRRPAAKRAIDLVSPYGSTLGREAPDWKVLRPSLSPRVTRLSLAQTSERLDLEHAVQRTVDELVDALGGHERGDAHLAGAGDPDLVADCGPLSQAEGRGFEPRSPASLRCKAKEGGAWRFRHAPESLLRSTGNCNDSPPYPKLAGPSTVNPSLPDQVGPSVFRHRFVIERQSTRKKTASARAS
jgi:hypothetical protein